MMLRQLVSLGVTLSLVGCASLGGSRNPSLPKPRVDPALAAAPQKREQTYEDYLKEGDRSRRAGRVSDAAWNYFRALRRQPSSPAPAERIGLLHLADRNLEEAQASFENALKSDPEAAVSRVGLGFALMEQGEFARAEEELLRARELRPEDALPLAALGVLYDALGKYEIARATYQDALRRAPQDPDLLNNLGTSYLITRDFERAADYLTRATELDPSNDVARNNLGLALGQQKRYDEAWAALRAGQSEVQALNNLGFIYYLNGDARNAIRYFEQALALPSEQREAIVRNLRRAEALLPPAPEAATPELPDAPTQLAPMLGPELPPLQGPELPPAAAPEPSVPQPTPILAPEGSSAPEASLPAAPTRAPEVLPAQTEASASGISAVAR